jgi:hypothetical protein
VSALRELRSGWVVLIYHNRKAFGLRAPIVQHRRLFRRGLLRWTPPPATLAPEEQRPHLELVPDAQQTTAEDAPRALPEPDQEAER